MPICFYYYRKEISFASFVFKRKISKIPKFFQIAIEKTQKVLQITNVYFKLHIIFI